MKALSAEEARSVRPHERCDNEITLLHRAHVVANVLNDANELVSHPTAGLGRLHRLVRPQIAAADGGASHTNQCVCRLNQTRIRNSLDTHIASAVHESCAHSSAPDFRRGGVFLVRHMITPSSGVSFIVHLLHRDMRHEPVRHRAMPVLLARLKEDTVARPDHLYPVTSPLTKAGAFEDPDRLPVRMLVPRRPRPGGEMHRGSTERGGVRRYRNRADVDGPAEPIGGAPGCFASASRNLHASS